MKLRVTFLFLFLLGMCAVGFTQGNSCKEDLLPRLGENRLYGYSDLFGNWKVIPFYTQAYPFSGNVAVVKKGVKYGVINCDGQVVLRPEYEDITTFIGGFSWVKQLSKWGLVNEKGVSLLEPIYDAVEDVSRFSDLSWVKENAKWGVYSKTQKDFLFQPQFIAFKSLTNQTALVQNTDSLFGIISLTTGVYVVQPIFNSVSKIIGNGLLVQKANKLGLLNDLGEELLPLEYDSILRGHRYRLKLLNNKEWLLSDEKGKVISSAYDSLFSYSGGAFRVVKNGRYGYLNYLGREVISCAYVAASDFKNKRAIVTIVDSSFLINPLNQYVSSGYNFLQFVKDNVYLVQKEGLYGLINEDGKEIVACVYDTINLDGGQLIRLWKEKGCVFFDLRTNRFLDDRFTDAKAFVEGYAIVVKEQLQGVVNEVGELVIPINFIKITPLPANCFVLHTEEGKQVVNAKGKRIGGEYKEVFASTSWPLIIQVKSGFGLLNLKGEEIVKPTYTAVICLNENYFALRKGKKVGVVSASGKEVLPVQYEEISNFSERFFNVKQKGKWGYVDDRNKVMIDFQFDAPAVFDAGKATVIKDGKLVEIDKKGCTIQ